MNRVAVGSTNGDELPRNGHGCPEQILPLLYPRVQEALLSEGRVHVARNLCREEFGRRVDRGTELGAGEEGVGGLDNVDGYSTRTYLSG